MTHETTDIVGFTNRAQADADVLFATNGSGTFATTANATRYRSLATLPSGWWQAERSMESGFTIVNSTGTSAVGSGTYTVDSPTNGFDTMTFALDPTVSHNHGYGGLVYGDTDPEALDAHNEVFAAREELLTLLFDEVHGL
ncbi:hypothetical protein CL628_01450 [bacterium]|nr:hypothetical protein [bacterium]